MFIKQIRIPQPQHITFIKWVSCVDLFIQFYQNEKKKKTNFSINQIDMNYEKSNK